MLNATRQMQQIKCHISQAPCKSDDQEFHRLRVQPKWPGFEMAPLRDPLSVHKVFTFWAFNSSDYMMDDFLKDIKAAETGDDENGMKAIFGETIISPLITWDDGNNVSIPTNFNLLSICIFND